MGRQIQIWMTIDDADKFKEFICGKFDCVIYKGFGVDEFDVATEKFCDSNGFYIWNKEFEWTPEYKWTVTENKLSYISNTWGAPLVEFSYPCWDSAGLHSGRIYWGKRSHNIAATYDIMKFEKFYNTLERWIKANAFKTTKHAGLNDYYFEQAWSMHELVVNNINKPQNEAPLAR